MSRAEERIAFLKSVPAFANCTKKELKTLDRLSSLVRIAEGTELMREDTAGETCVLIIKGTVSVRRRSHLITLLHEGEMVGELALFDRGPRTATVTAMTDLEVVRFDRTGLREAIRQAPDLGLHLIEALAGRLRTVDTAAYA